MREVLVPVLVAGLIGLSQYVKMLAYKQVADTEMAAAKRARRSYDATERARLTSDFTAVWMAGVTVVAGVLFHLFWPQLLDGFAAMRGTTLLWSVGKGINLFLILMAVQRVTGASLSSNAFWAFLSLAIGTLVLVAEGHPLSRVALVGIVGLGMLGILFLTYGHAARLDNTSKVWLGVCVACGVFNLLADDHVIHVAGWYPHVAVSYGVMLAICLGWAAWERRLGKLAGEILRPWNVRAGAAYAASEYILLPSMVTVLPVPVAFVAMRLANVAAMVWGARRYKEGSARAQFGFGLVALGLSLLVVLFR